MTSTRAIETPPSTSSDELEDGHGELIAIVGMGCRWPGGIRAPSQFWDFICAKESAYQEFDDSKFSIAGFHHENGQRPASMQTRGAYLLSEDPKLFDHAFFGMTGTEVATMDPAQRKMLEVVYEAFESAGETKEKYSGSMTGVFVGNFNNDHLLIQARDSDFASPHSSTGAGASILSNRINYLMDLKGPSITIDTACSSSLYALHLAVNAIRQGDCDSAIVGGSNLIMAPDVQLMLTKLGALSPTSSCHTFDASADGYARGEGFAAFYLKKLSDAMQFNYPVRAVIRGTAVNSNGRSAGLTHPSIQGQEAVIRQAYRSAKLDPGDTGYFEAHGTGTPVGDPLEVSAIGNVFSSNTSSSPLLIGSVKTNIGHTEATSGLAGVMKAVLALEANMVPPSRGIVKLNPQVEFEQANVQVVTELTPWPINKLRRVSVNSFGYGGANAHCIVDHISVLHADPEFTNGVVSLTSDKSLVSSQTQSLCIPFHYRPVKFQSPSAGTRRLVLLPFSAHDERALTRHSEAVLEAAGRHSLADVAYTLSCRRSRFQHRSYAIVRPATPNESIGRDISEPLKVQDSQRPAIGFIFTGQGAQWAAMGSGLMDYELFRNTIAYLDMILSRLSFRPEWRIQDVLSKTGQPSFHVPEVSQTVCTALQLGLVGLMRSWGLTPVATVGHSSGEIAAAYAAGYISAAEAIVIAYCRGVAVSKNSQEGLMLAVGLSSDAVMSYIADTYPEVEVAAVNSPNSVTLTGNAGDVASVSELLRAKGIFARILHTGGNAYHSSHMLLLGLEYEVLLTRALGELKTTRLLDDGDRCTQAQWISSVFPHTVMSRSAIRPFYWRQNLESTVQFSAAVQEMLDSTKPYVDIVIEVGPHSSLKAPVDQIWTTKRGKDIKRAFYYPTLIRGQDGMESLLHLCGSLFRANIPVDLEAVNAEDGLVGGKFVLHHGQTCTALPPYSFSYGPALYSESRLAKESRLRRHARHDILGSRQPGCSKSSPSWRNVLRIRDVPWLEHHKLLPHPVFPAAGYICMAVEAAFQVFTEDHPADQLRGYTLHDIFMHAAMRIPEDDRGLETILNLEQRHTSNGDSYTFKISSVTSVNTAWTMHCSGEVVPRKKSRADCTPLYQRIESPSDPRMLDSKSWYRTFTDTGLGYGPSFQGVSQLTSDPRSNTVAARISLKTTEGMFTGYESPYLLHPASLDACHQLAIIAGFQGHSESAEHAYVPVFLKRISLWVLDDPGDAFGTAVCHSVRRGIRGLYAQIQLTSQSGAPLADIEDLRCVAYGGRSDATEFARKPYRKLAWKPDIDHMDSDRASAIFPPTVAVDEGFVNNMNDLNRLSAYAVVEIATSPNFQPKGAIPQPHMAKFLSWAGRCAESDLPFVGEATATSSVDRIAMISKLSAQMKANVEVQLIKRVFDNLESIIAGRKSGLEVALQDGLLSQLYSSSVGIAAAYPQLGRVINLCAHRNPHLNILEIGAGTGGATRIVLEALHAKTQQRLFNGYTFTDVSTAFLSSAKSQFDFCDGMTFGILDIEEEPLEQGYKSEYDIVIASESLHTAKNINIALRHARSLLKPGGRLIIVETTQTLIGHGLVLGTFPDYWVGMEENRVDSPFMDTDHWNTALKRAGYSGINMMLDDYPKPWSIASVFVSRIEHKPPLLSSIHKDSLWLIHAPSHQNLASLLASKARQHGVQVTQTCESLPRNCRVIWFLETEALVRSGSDAWFASAKQLVQQSRSIVWVTDADTTSGVDPSGAIVWGMVRVISAENPHLRYAVVDVQEKTDNLDLALINQLLSLESRLQNTQPNEIFDREFVWKDRCIHISRLLPDHGRNDTFQLSRTADSSIRTLPLREQKAFKVAYEKPGILLSAYFKEDRSFLRPLPEDYIVAKTEAIGLNWKDVAVATGRFDLNNSSTEFSGVVTQVGSNVSSFSVGDNVYGFAFAHFGNYVRLPASFARKMPQGASFVDIATMPVVFASALYALRHIARLQRSQSVLIQSATGGLGIAAVQVAQLIGANIFATAGSEQKRSHLREVFQIPSNHIFGSREVPGVQQLLQATGGKGFDVILNTSSGLIMDATWSSIAPQGRFIDVGRVDIHAHGSIPLEPFNRNATFSSFDLGRLDASTLSELMGEVDNLAQANTIRPISPVTEFDVSQLGEALLKMSEGKHIGKIVVTYKNAESLIRMAVTPPSAAFDPNAVYIVAGGLGGLGRSLILWMAEHGARHFTALSRKTETTPEALAFLQTTRSQGLDMELTACDITVYEEVKCTITEVARQRTVKGVIHAAMALYDKLFSNLSFDEWERGLAAKVQGTLNLHDATTDLKLPLDFFVMTSSVSTQIAQPTQAAYCAANSFQDYFARYRRRLGLPATTIAFGLIHEVGELGRRVDVQNSMSRNDLYGTREYEFLELLEAAFLPDPSAKRDDFDSLATAHIVASLEPALLLKKQLQNRNVGIATQPRWHYDARFSHVLREMENLASSSNNPSTAGTHSTKLETDTSMVALDGLLREGEADKAKGIVLTSIVHRVADILFMPADAIDPSLSVVAYGIDSLVAAELRNWFITMYKCHVPFLKLLDPKTSMSDLADSVLGDCVEPVVSGEGL